MCRWLKQSYDNNMPPPPTPPNQFSTYEVRGLIRKKNIGCGAATPSNIILRPWTPNDTIYTRLHPRVEVWQKTNDNSKFVFSHLVHVLSESFVSNQIITTLIDNVSLFGFIKHQQFTFSCIFECFVSLSCVRLCTKKLYDIEEIRTNRWFPFLYRESQGNY